MEALSNQHQGPPVTRSGTDNSKPGGGSSGGPSSSLGEGRVPEVSFRLELDGRIQQPPTISTGRASVSPSAGSPVGGGSTGSAGGPVSMQKCLSFPRIVTDRPTSWSISPCQSRTYLDTCNIYPQSFLGGSEKSVDPDRLSIIGHAGLLRSMSARTVELERDRPEPESVNSSGSSSRYLSPACDRVDPLTNRSTSCPSMAYTEHTGAGRTNGGLPPGTTEDVRHLLFRRGDAEEDINLEGEEIDDLPIEPNTVFPELPPDLIESCRPDPANLSLKGLKLTEDSPKPTIPPSGTKPGDVSSTDPSTTTNTGNGREKGQKGQSCTKAPPEGPFVNIRDLPRSTMSDAMKQHHVGLSSGGPNMDTNQKCLRWLNTLPAQRS